MKDLSKEDLFTLEALVDKYSVRDVVGALAQIAYDKEAHIEESWQDKTLAGAWRDTAVKLDRFAFKL